MRAVEELRPQRDIDAERDVVRDFLDDAEKQSVHALSCSRKLRYATQELATVMANAEGRRLGRWFVPYQCAACGQWHIGRRLGSQFINARRPDAASERPGEWVELSAEKHRLQGILSGLRGPKNSALHRKRKHLVELLASIEQRMAEIKAQRQTIAAVERLAAEPKGWRFDLMDRLQEPYPDAPEMRLIVRTLVSVAWIAERVVEGTETVEELGRAVADLADRAAGVQRERAA